MLTPLTDGARGYRWLGVAHDFCFEHKYVIHNIDFKIVD